MSEYTIKKKKKHGCLKFIGIIILIIIVLSIIGNLISGDKKTTTSKEPVKQEQKTTKENTALKQKETKEQKPQIDETTEIKEKVVPLYKEYFGEFFNIDYKVDTKELRLYPKNVMANDLRVYDSNRTEKLTKAFNVMLERMKESSKIITEKGYKDIVIELVNPDNPSLMLVKIVNGKIECIELFL